MEQGGGNGVEGEQRTCGPLGGPAQGEGMEVGSCPSLVAGLYCKLPYTVSDLGPCCQQRLEQFSKVPDISLSFPALLGD